MTRLLPLLCLLALPLPLAAASEALAPFAAEYRIRYIGLPMKAKGERELRQEADGSYVLRSSARWLLSRVEETSRFRLVDGRLLPVRYDYQRRGLGGKKHRFNAFDWAADGSGGRASHAEGSLAVAPGTLDKLLYQLQLRLDLKAALAAGEAAGREFSYPLADDGRIREYRFRLLGQETIDTPAGELAACKLERVRKKEGRQTRFWLAPAYDYLLVRLEQREEDGKGFTLELKEVKEPPQALGRVTPLCP